MEIDWKRTAFISVAVIAGVFAGIFGQPYIHGNERAINIIVTAFSILAGFLVAIMAIMSDPTGFVTKNWRYVETVRPNIYRKLSRQKYLFILYLGILCLIFIESLIEKNFPCIARIIEQIYFGAAVCAFILSMGLPATLMKIQMDRHDEMIEGKRKASGIK